MPRTPIGQFDSTFKFPRSEDFKRPVTFYDIVRFVGSDSTLSISGGIFTGDIRSSTWNGAVPANLATVDGTATLGYYLDESAGSAQFEGDLFLGGTISGGTISGATFIGGDYESSNWGGASPANLTARDASGTPAGFYLDASLGAAQFEGDVWVGGNIELSTTGKVRTATSGDRIEIASSHQSDIRFYENAIANYGRISGQTNLLLTPSYDTGRSYGSVSINQGHVTVAENAVGIGMGGASTDFTYALGVGTGTLGSFQATGDIVVKFNVASQIVANQGSAALPSYTFNTTGGVTKDADTGMYRYAADEIGMATAGVARFRLDSGGSLNLGGIGTTGMALLRNSANTAATPTYGFQGDTDTGMYRRGENEIGWSVGTADRMYLDTYLASATTGAPAIKFDAAGSATTPTYSFAANTDLGMYRASVNVLAFATAGVLRGSFQADGIYATTPNTTGLAANLFTAGAAHNNFQRSTSARKYKSRITYNVDYLADYELRPTKHYRKDDGRWFYGLIADDLGDQDKLLGVYEDGEIENYDSRAVMTVMAAKINRLEEQLDKLSHI